MIKTITISEPTAFSKVISDEGLNFPVQPGEYCLEWKKVRKQRSLKQNRFYWGYILPYISMETGYEIDELHDFFRLKYKGKMVKLGNSEVEIGQSTKEMDTKEFSDYVEWIRNSVLQVLSIYIPTLEELTDADIKRMEEDHSNRYYK